MECLCKITFAAKQQSESILIDYYLFFDSFRHFFGNLFGLSGFGICDSFGHILHDFFLNCFGYFGVERVKIVDRILREPLSFGEEIKHEIERRLFESRFVCKALNALSE